LDEFEGLYNLEFTVQPSQARHSHLTSDPVEDGDVSEESLNEGTKSCIPSDHCVSDVLQASNDKIQSTSTEAPYHADNAKEAYLLTEVEVGKPPSVAILCGGTKDEMNALMMSAIYHRSIWGISEPLVGFCWDHWISCYCCIWMD